MHIHNLRSMDNGKIHCFQIIGKRIQNFLNGAFNANKKNFGSAFLTGFQSSGDNNGRSEIPSHCIHCQDIAILHFRLLLLLGGLYTFHKQDIPHGEESEHHRSNKLQKVLQCGRVIGACLFWNEIFYFVEQPFQSP